MNFKRLNSTFRTSIVSICVVLVTMLSCKDELIETKVKSKNTTGIESAMSAPKAVVTDPLLDSARAEPIVLW